MSSGSPSPRLATGRELADALAAIRPRDEAVKRRMLRRRALRPIDAQIAGDLVAPRTSSRSNGVISMYALSTSGGSGPASSPMPRMADGNG